MYARLLATLCLLTLSAFSARADSSAPAGTALDVYVKGQAGSTPDVLMEIKRELGALMQTAGFRVNWRSAGDPPSPTGAEHLVIVELRGVCMPQFATMVNIPLSSAVPLASSAVADGRVLPFTRVDCASLNRFLAPVASNLSMVEQNTLYGRSIARLLAHELYHVLAQTNDHAPSGIAKARFSTADLLADHFDFETVALDRLHPPALIQSGDDTSVSGR